MTGGKATMFLDGEDFFPQISSNFFKTMNDGEKNYMSNEEM